MTASLDTLPKEPATSRRDAPDLTGPDGRARSWAEIHSFAERLLGPGLERAVSAIDPSLHPDRDVVATTVEVRNTLLGEATPQVALLADGQVELVRPGRCPVWSPDGRRLAHLVEDGVQLDGAHFALGGFPERLAWSPDGSKLLVVLAEPGSELSNIAASGLLPRGDAWLPQVSSPTQNLAWRRLVVLDVGTLQWSVVGRPDLNVWDACWAGPGAVLAVCSDGSPTESAFYQADLRRLETETGIDTVVGTPSLQLGAIAGSPSGRYVAYVEGVCSDRGIVAGRLDLVDTVSGSSRTLAVPADVTAVEFVDDALLGFTGLRGLTTVLGTVTSSGQVEVVWESERETALGWQPQASFRAGRTAFIRGGFTQPPEACVVRTGAAPISVASLAHAGSAVVTEGAWTSRPHRWLAPDGLEIEGWLHLPDTDGPHPLIVSVHGGPIAGVRSSWPGANLAFLTLLSRGYAILQPNPRGSTGRGSDFAGAVVGDMGGADSKDLEAGVTDLISAGLVDPSRVGVMGGSYGGYMTAWLVSQSDLFAAAVSMYPVTDWAFQHGASSIPLWDELFLDGRPYANDGQYAQRSPLTHADLVRTPTLFIAGDRDRACPPGQTLAMHRALLARQVPSECVIYPLEGHGARDMSAVIDVTARISDWFEHWMPSGQQ